MKLKSAIGAVAVSFLIILLINLIKGVSIGGLFLRALIGSVFIGGIVYGVMFVFSDVLNISSSGGSAVDDKPAEDGANVNFVVGDDDSVSGENGDSGTQSTFQQETEKNGENNQNGFEETNYASMDSIGETPIDEKEFDYTDDRPPVNSDGASVKDKLGFDASYDDIVKAIRTTMRKE